MSNEEKTVENNSQEDKVKSYSEEQFKGLLADKQAEVKKRQRRDNGTDQREEPAGPTRVGWVGH